MSDDYLAINRDIRYNPLVDGDWRSWLARAVWDREVEGSSPLSPTKRSPGFVPGFLLATNAYSPKASVRM